MCLMLPREQAELEKAEAVRLAKLEAKASVWKKAEEKERIAVDKAIKETEQKCLEIQHCKTEVVATLMNWCEFVEEVKRRMTIEKQNTETFLTAKVVSLEARIQELQSELKEKDDQIAGVKSLLLRFM